jgi:putative heme transporter
MSFDERLVRGGRRAWAALGIVVLAVAILYAAGRISLVVTAFVIALFPAALMSPIVERLRRTGLPDILAALVGLVLLLLTIVLPAWLIIPMVIDQAPDLTASALEGIERLEEQIDWAVLPGDPEGPREAMQELVGGAGGGDFVGDGLSALGTLVHTLTGIGLVLVILFFCLKDGRRLWQAMLDFVPERRQQEVDELATRAWWQLGAYLRGQLLVALFDAVFIGLGLWFLDVPLALPLAVIVFFGGLFPIVGAFVAGFVAILVAFADQGPVTALLVLGLIVLVQQIESNVFEPLVMSNIIGLHPLVVILAIIVGSMLLGVFGAFISVPLAAIVAMLVDHLRGRDDERSTEPEPA